MATQAWTYLTYLFADGRRHLNMDGAYIEESVYWHMGPSTDPSIPRRLYLSVERLDAVYH